MARKLHSQVDILIPHTAGQKKLEKSTIYKSE